ncbi:MAG TPA: helix-turn-helix domain-containing protein, partial [Pseudonocardia sp.]
MATPVRECSIANALAVIGERWSLLALREVFFGVRRFDQIQRNTGASRDILAARLRTLVEHGVLRKVQYEQHPPRYEYVLTEAGQ